MGTGTVPQCPGLRDYPSDFGNVQIQGLCMVMSSTSGWSESRAPVFSVCECGAGQASQCILCLFFTLNHGYEKSEGRGSCFPIMSQNGPPYLFL